MTRGGAVLLQLPAAQPQGPGPGFDPWIFSPELIAALAIAPLGNVLSDWPQIAQEMANNGVWSRESAAGMIGTMGIETAHTFKPVKEAFYLANLYGWSEAQVEAWREDNLWYYPYYGRGYIQTTHDYNYGPLGVATGLDLLANPDLATLPWVAAVGAASYWRSRNIQAVAEAHNWPEVRRRVLGSAPADDVAYITRVAETLLAA